MYQLLDWLVAFCLFESRRVHYVVVNYEILLKWMNKLFVSCVSVSTIILTPKTFFKRGFIMPNCLFGYRGYFITSKKRCYKSCASNIHDVWSKTYVILLWFMCGNINVACLLFARLSTWNTAYVFYVIMPQHRQNHIPTIWIKLSKIHIYTSRDYKHSEINLS